MSETVTVTTIDHTVTITEGFMDVTVTTIDHTVTITEGSKQTVSITPAAAQSVSVTAVYGGGGGGEASSGFRTISSGTLDGGLHSTTSFNQITDLFIDGSTFDGGTP